MAVLDPFKSVRSGSRVANRQGYQAFLRVVRAVCVCATLLIVVPTLLGWALPRFGTLLPAGWTHMKANTALLSGMSLGSLLLTERGRARRSIMAGRFVAIAVFLFALLSFLQFFSIHTVSLDTLLAADPGGIVPGRPSIQACVGFMLMSFALVSVGWHKLPMLQVADGAALLLCLFLLSFVGASFFTRDGLPGWSLTTQLSVQAFVCFCMLTVLVMMRRMEPGGVFHIFLDRGIGGRTARLAGPAALVLPFLIASLREAMVRFHILTLNYAIAIAPAITAMLAVVFVLLLARKNRELEQAIQNLSLRDELTGLYNRRGFLLLAERGFREAQREGTDLSIVFFDVDNLKAINDTAGHEDGSRLLKHFAEALQHGFRLTDMVGRLGGDEFVVAATVSGESSEDAVERMQHALLRDRGPALSFSYGVASLATDNGSLDTLIQLADHRMYEAKRQKKLRA